MASSDFDYLAKQWRDSVTGGRNLLREMEAATAFQPEIERSVNLAARGKTLFGNSLGLILKELQARNEPKPYFHHRLLGGELEKAMKSAMGLTPRLEEALVGNLGALEAGVSMINAAHEAAVKPIHDLLRDQRESLVGAVDDAIREAMKPTHALLRAQRDIEQTINYGYSIGLEQAHVRAIGGLIPSLDRLANGHLAAVGSFIDSLATSRAVLGISNFALWTRENFDSFWSDLYRPGGQAPFRDPSEWIEEALDELLTSSPEYTRSKLAWILAIFVPRFRLALYRQDQEGHFEDVMMEFWEEVVQDPQVRTRLRERLEKSGLRKELREFLSRHLDKVEEGEFEYAILGLYSHIEAFLAEIAVQHGLIPNPEIILCPKSGMQPRKRRGVGDLIEVLYREGRLSESQNRFLTFVLSNEYDSNRIRHGLSFDFSQSRATALVLALILALCLAWDMEASELLEPDQENQN